MKLSSQSFREGQAIPLQFAVASIGGITRTQPSRNLNPHLAWSDVPARTRSFAVTVIDFDAPATGEDVNREYREIAINAPRGPFTHWVLLDIPLSVRQIPEGYHSSGFTRGGKPGPDAGNGMRHGVNDYTHWFATDLDLKGQYYGYDGPCPPWNDRRVHRYTFTVYALDVEHLDLPDDITWQTFDRASKGHVLASTSIVGLYTLNPLV
jgi:Raf kinase inhibitor-like YbhB/YbcL family protein